MNSLTDELLLPCSFETESIILQPSVQEYFADFNAHRRLLKDEVRLDAFRKAIYETVKPGDVVMDIGAGTGILSQYALEAGASVVYLIEENGHLLSIAEDIISSQFPLAEVYYISKRSTALADLDISQKADVIVSETIGSIGINEGILPTLADSKRFLKKSGIFIPQNLEVLCCPYSTSSPPFPNNKCTIFRSDIDCLNYMLSTYSLFSFCFSEEIKLSDSISIVFNKSFLLSTGLCFWFEARLSRNIFLNNYLNSNNNSWGKAIIPIKNYKKIVVDFFYSHDKKDDTDKLLYDFSLEQSINKHDFFRFWILGS